MILDIQKIKQDGLSLDLQQIKEKGTLALTPEDAYRLKTYGFCTQKHPGYFILRIRIPGGIVTAHQLTVLAEIIETHGRCAAHLTGRQGLEIRFVRVDEIEEIGKKLQSIGLSSRSTDGHTVRNVMACPHGGIIGLWDVRPWAKAVSDYFVEQSDRINTLLPNRLNIFFSACSECRPYAAINDMAFVATPSQQGHARGFELWGGGSLGPSPRLGFKIKDVLPAADVLPACSAIVSVYTNYFRSNGCFEKDEILSDITTNQDTRLKVIIERVGKEKFIALFEKALSDEKAKAGGTILAEEHEKQPLSWVQFFEEQIAFLSPPLPDGSSRQKQKGYALLKVAVPFGEIRASVLTEIGRIAKRYGNGNIYFTRNQDLEIPWIPIRKIPQVTDALSAIGLSLKGKDVYPLACSGVEFCSQAKTHAQGTARELLKILKSDNPEKRSFLKGLSVHISGCQNGCARHALSDIGLAGDIRDEESFYRLYLGGGVSDPFQVGKLIHRGIPERHIILVINALIGILFEHRREGETFRDVVLRVPTDTISEQLEIKIAACLPKEDTFEMIPYIMDTL